MTLTAVIQFCDNNKISLGKYSLVYSKTFIEHLVLLLEVQRWMSHVSTTTFHSWYDDRQ